MSPEYGVFARVFARGSADDVAAAITGAGYTVAQLNLSALGLPTIPGPERWDAVDVGAIADAFDAAGVRRWGLSCSYNMAHPDPAVRRAGTEGAVALIARAPGFGVEAVTLCTGSRDADRMWAPHPDNASDAAWFDLRAELDVLLAAATEAGVRLGVEPEPGNVVRDAAAALRLLDELGDDARHVTVVLDPANLVHEHPRGRHAEVLRTAFTSLGPWAGCVHAKDVVPWSESLDGRGVVDYALVGRLWGDLPLAPPVVVQDAQPQDAAAVRRYVAAAFG